MATWQEDNKQTPWYQKLVTLFLLPFGAVTLWRRSSLPIKLFTLAGVLALGGLSVYAAYRLNRNREQEAHFALLEQQRAAQQQAPEPQTQVLPQTPALNPPVLTNNTAPPAIPAPATPANQPATASNLQATQTVKPNQKTSAHAPAPPAREYWTDFRGPLRDGHYQESTVNTNWGQGLTPLWKQPIGLGFASFVVGEGRAYTIEQRRDFEVAAAYDINTGRELWKNQWSAKFSDSTGDGPRATPTYEAGRVYTLGAQGELRALDAKTGKDLWNKNVLVENGAENLSWGVSASPLIVDDKVVVMVGAKGGKSIVAYNKMNGARVWGALDDSSSYTAPMLSSLNGKRQIVAVTGTRLVGLAPENGALLWEYPWANSLKINVSQPIQVDATHIFMSAGYGKGAALVEITGSGPKYTARTVWENQNMKNKFNSSVLYNGYVYGLDEGILSCVNVMTGERKWKGGRYGYGQLLLANGHLIITAEDGRLALVKATPEAFSEVTQFKALEGKTWNVPALTGGKLLVRNATEMACYNLAAQ